MNKIIVYKQIKSTVTLPVSLFSFCCRYYELSEDQSAKKAPL